MGVRGFAAGEPQIKTLRTLCWAAHAAAAARSAMLARASAYTHALADAHQVKHVLGPAVYAALARGLASHGEPGAADEELNWATAHASATVREVVRRFPAARAGRTPLGDLLRQLDTAIRTA